MAVGIKQTTELVDAVAALAEAVALQLKDGFQYTDIGEVFAKALQDKELNAKLVAGFNGVLEVPAEVADLNWFEGIKLGSHVLGVVRSVAEKISK